MASMNGVQNDDLGHKWQDAGDLGPQGPSRGCAECDYCGMITSAPEKVTTACPA